MLKLRRILFVGMPVCGICILLFAYLSVKHTSFFQMEHLEGLLKEARQREEKAIVIRHVSKQMEEIAFQQKEIAEKQRKKAEVQALENFYLKQDLEDELEKAVVAEQKAVEAYQQADQQKALAEERLCQAEYAKRVADTLTYLILGRSLGSLSITQYKAGNDTIAALLAYSSWNFIGRYHGDIFLPEVFNSLSLSVGKSFRVQKHKEGITAIVLSPVPEMQDTLYTVSKYGEILSWNTNSSGACFIKTLLSDSQYDFRDACMDSNGVLYALSHDGKLLKYFHGQFQRLTLNEKNYSRIIPVDGDFLLLSATNGLSFLGEKKFSCHIQDITQAMKADNCLLVGCRNGEVFQVTLSGEKVLSMKTDTNVAVTALAYCRESGQYAIGYDNGTLALFEPDGKSYRKLIGHYSAITGLAFHNDKLYSCSYDRTLRLWNLSAERMESVVILESASWLCSMELNRDKEIILSGDGSGNLYYLSISPDNMATNIKEKMHRNFTEEEWIYYIGDKIPFETYIP